MKYFKVILLLVIANNTIAMEENKDISDAIINHCLGEKVHFNNSKISFLKRLYHISDKEQENPFFKWCSCTEDKVKITLPVQENSLTENGLKTMDKYFVNAVTSGSWLGLTLTQFRLQKLEFRNQLVQSLAKIKPDNSNFRQLDKNTKCFGPYEVTVEGQRESLYKIECETSFSNKKFAELFKQMKKNTSH